MVCWKQFYGPLVGWWEVLNKKEFIDGVAIIYCEPDSGFIDGVVMIHGPDLGPT
jgi:hypothetical protein